MGKYTSLARNFRDETKPFSEEQKKGTLRNTSVNINRNVYIEDSNTPSLVQEGVTTLRPTTLTTLIKDEKDEKRTVICIHEMQPNDCAVCSGYVRWLIADEARLQRAKGNPESVRREFWRHMKGSGVSEGGA